MAQAKKFGTFGGVFTPSILTILGVIMYLRFPWIIGQTGLWTAVGIILVAHLISLTTGLSVASIATDKKVKTGGTYYMISRSLGLPIGGTLGLALFVGLSFSVSLYLIGFAESFLNYFDFEVTKNSIRIAGTSVLILVTIITFISTSLAIKSQYIIMTAIGLSLLSILLGFGHHDFTPTTTQLKPLADAAPFMILFGIFFPAVTGFEAGVSMSGDLQNPKRSLPIGAIAAIAVGFTVYILLAIFFTTTVDANALVNDPNILFKISLVPQLVIAGIWGATLSSALGSILGAPRILQATAMDKITPNFFAKGYGLAKEPRNALLMTFIIAEAGILIGELDVIARIVSMFFITTYAFLNLAAYIESWSSSDFNPSFKIPKIVSLAGATASIIVMILLDFIALIGAVFVLALLFLFLKRRQLILDSGDAWSSFSARLVKNNLSKLSIDELKMRNWRPNILFFSKNNLIIDSKQKFANALTGRLGLLTQINLYIKPNSIEKLTPITQKKEKFSENFKKSFITNNFYDAINNISKIYGFSGVQPNTVILSLPENDEEKIQLGKLIKSNKKGQISTLIYQHNEKKSNYEKIDFWWAGKGASLALALSLFRQLQQSNEWRNARLRVLHIKENYQNAETIHHFFNKTLDNFRLNAEFKLIENSIDKSSRTEIINIESLETDLTILGISEEIYIKNDLDSFNSFFCENGSALYIHASENFKDMVKDLPYNISETVIKQKTGLKLKESESLELNLIFGDIYEKYIDIINDFENSFIKTHNSGFLTYISKIEGYTQNVFNQLNKIVKSEKENNFIEKLSTIQYSYIVQVKKVSENANENYFEPEKEIVKQGFASLLIKASDTLKSINKKVKINNKKKTIPLRDIISYFGNHKLYLSINNFFKTSDTVTSKIFNLLNSLLNDFNSELLKFRSQNTVELEKMRIKYENRFLEINNIIKNDIQYDTQNIITAYFNEAIFLAEKSPKKEIIKTVNLEKSQISKAGLFIEAPDNSFKIASLHNQSLLVELNTLITKNQADKIIHKTLNSIKNYINTDITDKSKEIKELISKSEIKETIFKTSDFIQINLKEDFIASYNEFRQFVQTLPEIVILRDIYSDNETDEHTVNYRKIANSILENSFYSPIFLKIKEIEQNINKLIYTLKDSIRLFNFNISNLEKLAENEAEKNSIIENTIIRIDNIIESIKNEFTTYKIFIDKTSQSAFDKLHSYSLLKASAETVEKNKKIKSWKIYKKSSELITKISNFIYQSTEKIIYRKSEGLLFAEKFIANERNTDKIFNIVKKIEKNIPKQEILSTLPVSYLNLFSKKYTISEDLRIERKEESIKAEKALKMFNEESGGALMIIGEPQSGKTDFAKKISGQHFTAETTVKIKISGSENNKNTLFVSIKKAFGINIEPEQILENLPEKHIIIFDNLELWWLRNDSGTQNIEKILELIEKFGKRHFFVLICNTHTYRFLQNIIPLDDYFNTVIECRPINAEKIKEIVLLRHRAGNLSYTVKGKKEENISKIKKAAMFNSIFNYTRGNIGNVLNAWKLSIDSYQNGNIEIKKIFKPDLSVFELIDDGKLIIIIQIIIHKSMTVSDLKKVLNVKNKELSHNLNFLKRSLIVNQTNKTFSINENIENQLIQYLKNKNLLS